MLLGVQAWVVASQVAETWKGPPSLQQCLLEVEAEGGRGASLFLRVNLC